MLIATAGHVDHGKTTLVQTLTGVDTDRLPEEKQRGVSIDLGFAYHDLGSDHRFGFVDVPGHEKFVRNMLAGVSAVDAVMLVIAADDGPMPQTHEHLAILNLLGVSTGLVALTRCDLVDDAQRIAAAQACEALLDSTPLAGSPVLPVSATTGVGMDALRAELIRLAGLHSARSNAGRFRLAIDRSFSVPGTGLVVTGTVFSGEASVGESVNLAPAGVSSRIRGLHVHNAVSQSAPAGVRCAINLNATDLGRIQPRRGDWLIGDPPPPATRRLDVSLSLLASEARPLAHWTSVHVHHGAGSYPARVALLDGRRIEPGGQGLAQLVLDTDTVAIHGDKLIVRDQSARRTIGGGRVIDPFGPARGRARDARLAILGTMQSSTAATAFDRLLAESDSGVDVTALAQTWNMTGDELSACLAATESVPVTIQLSQTVSTTRHVLPARWQSLCDAILAWVSDFHREQPQQTGPTELTVRRALSDAASRELLIAAINWLVAGQKMARQGPHLRLPEHQAGMSAEQEAQWQRVATHLGPDVLRPPVVTDLAKELKMTKAALDKLLSALAQRGQLTRFAANRYYHPVALATLAAIAEKLGHNSIDGFDARAFRDATGIGRNLTIEVLEFFDNRQLTRRVGDKRVVVGSAQALFGAGTPENT